jgi:hypothetical protein
MNIFSQLNGLLPSLAGWVTIAIVVVTVVVLIQSRRGINRYHLSWVWQLALSMTGAVWIGLITLIAFQTNNQLEVSHMASLLTAGASVLLLEGAFSASLILA